MFLLIDRRDHVANNKQTYTDRKEIAVAIFVYKKHIICAVVLLENDTRGAELATKCSGALAEARVLRML